MDGRRLAIAWAVACTILLSACSRGSGGAPGAGAAAPSPSPSRSGASEPDFFSGGRCPRSPYPELPAEAGCVTSAVEGDERLLVYALLGRGDKPRAWRARLVGAGDELDQRLRQSNVWSYPRALGATDVDHDGGLEWWIKVADYGSHGAAWGGLNVYVLARGALRPVTFEGEPLTVDFGGITRLGQGAVCRDGELVVLRAWARDRRNTRWWVSERRLELDGRRAHFLGRTQRSLVVDSYVDPDLVRNYRVECYGKTFTPFD